MTTLVDYTDRFLNTADALDYTIHEIDDLTDRKVEAVEVDGDALARVVRARRGTARATGQPDPYGARHTVDTARRVWGSYRGIWIGENTSRRMVAVGVTGKGMHVESGLSD